MGTGTHDADALFPREAAVLTDGAVHLPGLLGPARQRELLASCRAWALPPAGLRTVRTRGGAMSVRQVSLGWHWSPARGYTRTAVDGDGARVKTFPGWLGDWAAEAVTAAVTQLARAGRPASLPTGGPLGYDIALVNYYPAGARMGMHQDADERSSAPVVSFSLGDAGVFRLGSPESRTRPWRDSELRSGDALVFGGSARLAYHGVPRTHPGTSPPALGLTGRINVTVRVSGLG